MDHTYQSQRITKKIEAHVDIYILVTFLLIYTKGINILPWCLQPTRWKLVWQTVFCMLSSSWTFLQVRHGRHCSLGLRTSSASQVLLSFFFFPILPYKVWQRRSLLHSSFPPPTHKLCVCRQSNWSSWQWCCSQLLTPPLKSHSLFFIGIGEGCGAVLRTNCNAQMIIWSWLPDPMYSIIEED